MSEDGHPQSALVGIAVTQELEIVFDTLNSSRKYRNLIQHPSCSLVIGWDGEQTVQYEGIATEHKGQELKRPESPISWCSPDGSGTATTIKVLP